MDLLETYKRLGCIDTVSDIDEWDKAHQEFLHELKKVDRRNTPTKPIDDFCPNCESFIEDERDLHLVGAYDYCPWCGQAIDWSDE